MKKKYFIGIIVLSLLLSIFMLGIFTIPVMALEGEVGVISEIEDVANTDKFIKMNLYDYSNNANVKNRQYSGYVPAFVYTGGVPDAYLVMPSRDFLNDTNSFAIGDILITDSSIYDPPALTGAPGSIDEKLQLTKPVRGVMKKNLVNGYPVVGPFSYSLDYLFSDNTYAKKQNKDENGNPVNISHLFQYDPLTEKYYYNSRENHAEFNGKDKFIVYDKKITPNYLMYPFGNFMPFNKIKTNTTQVSSLNANKTQELINNMRDSKVKRTYQKFHDSMVSVYGSNYEAWDGIYQFMLSDDYVDIEHDEDVIKEYQESLDTLYNINFDVAKNFFFGFDMEMQFMQPKSGVIESTNENMVFRFEGDDDVWVYIDDVLFLDLSGIHKQVGGEIDFGAGVVRYYDFDQKTNAAGKNKVDEVSFSSILSDAGVSTSLLSNGKFKDFTSHSMKFFYMERGASSGVMSLEFNMPLIEKDAITISKEVVSEGDVNDESLYNFQIMKPNSTSTIVDDKVFLNGNYKYKVYKLSDNSFVRDGQTDANGIITIKNGEYAVVSGINATSGNYYVRELLEKDNLNKYKSVTVNSVVKEINVNQSITINSKEYVLIESNTVSGTFKFEYINEVIPSYGKLSIKKVLSNTSEGESFDIEVTINGKKLQVGSNYIVDGKTKSVVNEGIITLTANQTATIENIIVGSSFNVIEVNNDLYIDSYKLDGVDKGNDGVAGVISSSDGANVVVTNTLKHGAEISIPVKKITTNPDGVQYTYAFVLLDEKNNEISRKYITVEKNGIGNVDEEGNVKPLFNLEYLYKDFSSSKTLKYKIREEKITILNGVENSDDKYTLYDETVYDVEVKVVKNDTGLTATYSVKENNETVDEIVFNNKRLASLTIEKIVDGRTKTGKFNFEIESIGLEDGTYKTDSGTIEFKNGKSSVVLSHNESITIYGIPNGAVFRVTETNPDGYVTLYKVNASTFNKGNSVTNVTLSNIETSVSQNNPFGISYDTLVTFKNVQGYELPKTGSSGMLILTFVGTLFMSISLMYLIKRK